MWLWLSYLTLNIVWQVDFDVWQKKKKKEMAKWPNCTCLLVFFLLGSISLSVLNYMGFYASAQERHGETVLEGQG